MKKLFAILTVAVLGFASVPAQADDHSQNVILINAFTVPADKIDEAIAMWEMARDFLKEQPGYVSTKLHRSLSPDAKYLLINVAEWESPETYKAATGLMRKTADLPKIEGVVPGPGLYKVIRN